MNIRYFCGFNGFSQFETGTKKYHPKDFLKEFTTELPGNFQIGACNWSYNVYFCENEVLVSGFLKNSPKQTKKFTFSSKIKEFSSNDDYCLALLENEELFKINIKSLTAIKLNFHMTAENQCQKRNIFGEIQQNSKHIIEHISCGRTFSVAVTRKGEIYNIPSKIFEFPKHVKVKSLVCGYEHALLLTNNGDLYSWGNGLRGQLGHPEISIQETPQLVEPLAGIKVTVIAAAGWHSAAITAFGDLYLWGSNANGQLGFEIYKKITTTVGDCSVLRKNPTVYPTPQLIEFGNGCCSNDCDIIEVSCGARHTFVKRKCGQFYCTGWNQYGQLGIRTEKDFLDTFTKYENMKNFKYIKCEGWCTVFVS